MPKQQNEPQIPTYRGRRWIRGGLPSAVEPWQPFEKQGQRAHGGKKKNLAQVVKSAAALHRWWGPSRPVLFIADPHADAAAFADSLVASGGVCKFGPSPNDITLTNAGRESVFVIGGDCLDKGPSNLDLLRCIRVLMETGARVKLLAGNHDLRLLMGVLAINKPRDVRSEHFFVRMGPKVVPLLKEVYDTYLKGKDPLKGIPGRKACRQRLYPSPDWFERFPEVAGKTMPKQAIERELSRMRKKIDGFETACENRGLSLRHVFAVAKKCQSLFLRPGGEFSWFFHDMQLAYRSGSYLFIHAGIDDRVARMLGHKGVHRLNRLFRRQIEHDLFEFYYGPIANTMRTKYRKVDRRLTHKGVEDANRRGVHVIVHGHRNRVGGQRIAIRHGLIHIESDITMDRNSRKREGLDGYGAGVTIVERSGRVLGISTDYPAAKVFEPCNLVRKPLKRKHATE